MFPRVAADFFINNYIEIFNVLKYFSHEYIFMLHLLVQNYYQGGGWQSVVAIPLWDLILDNISLLWWKILSEL